MAERKPRVAMVVNNGMANDARVIKTAATLARAGAEVTVLGVASPGHPRQEATAGGARYIRLPALPRRGLSARYVHFAARRRLGRLGPAHRWGASLPVLRLYAAAFVPELRAIEPDVVHVHDVHALDAVRAAFPTSPRPRIIYDAHEYVSGLAVSGARTQRAVDAWAALERDRIDIADRVITVAPAIAERLERERALPAPVAVVYNCPLLWPTRESSRDLRAEAGVGPEDRLVVYSGAVSMARGLDTVIRAVALTDDVHLAIVTVPHPHPMAPELSRLASTHGVAGRVHIVPPVPSHEVPAYLHGADAAVSPIRGDAASYDMALPNKLFEYIHAGLPVVSSDLRGMSEFIRANHLGQVFRQGDPEECARAITTVLADDEERDASALAREFSWQAQEPALVAVYRSLAETTPSLGQLHASDDPWDPADLTLDFAVPTGTGAVRAR